MPETDATTTQDGVSAARPELFVGAALLGGFILAQVLKRLGDDD
jgi:hypothetical protein